MDAKKLNELTIFVQKYIPTAQYTVEDGSENQVIYSLPFDSVKLFGPFFSALEKGLNEHDVSNFGVTITSLEDVFLKVGEDHSVTPKEAVLLGIGSDRSYNTNFLSQIIGLVKRKLHYASNDFITIPFLALPIIASIAAAVLYKKQIISSSDLINDMAVSGIYIGGYLGAPGLIAEFIVRERNERLRNVLTVMGCDFKAYWIGTFIADYILMFMTTFVMWISWSAGDMTDFYDNGLNFFVFLLFNFQMISFSYFFSYIFSSPKSCISLMPVVILLLILFPAVVFLILIEIILATGTTLSQGVLGIFIYLLTFMSAIIYFINRWCHFVGNNDHVPTRSTAVMLTKHNAKLQCLYF
jgi:hypothetical protein